MIWKGTGTTALGKLAGEKSLTILNPGSFGYRRSSMLPISIITMDTDV
jgi:hypothetical protein